MSIAPEETSVSPLTRIPRMRLGTALLWIVILALVFALVVQHQRFTRREAELVRAAWAARNVQANAIFETLERPLQTPSGGRTLPWGFSAPLRDFVQVIQQMTVNEFLPEGLAVSFDLEALKDPVAMLKKSVIVASPTEPAAVAIEEALRGLGLATYVSSDGPRLRITTPDRAAKAKDRLTAPGHRLK